MSVLAIFRAATIAATIVFSGLMGFSSSLYATTPDGETPANEGVCDSLHGGTPGLYGLCIAYCEAQDLNSIDKEPPNTKILANYRKKMKAGDPDMPCIQAPCVCATDAELAEMTSDGVGTCNRLITNKISITDDGVLNFADTDTTAGRERCRYIDIGASPSILRIQTITAEEAQDCFAAIDSACSDLGQ